MLIVAFLAFVLMTEALWIGLADPTCAEVRGPAPWMDQIQLRGRACVANDGVSLSIDYCFGDAEVGSSFADLD